MRILIFILFSFVIVGISFLITINLPPNDFITKKLLGGDDVYLKNKVFLKEKEVYLKIVYFDKNKQKINVDYKILDNNGKPILYTNLNIFDFLSYNDELYKIELLKKTKDIEKEFSEKLDENGLVGYYDKDVNNLYIFGHNGTDGINGGRLFYYLKPGDKLTLWNSLSNFNKTFVVDDIKILNKSSFINQFVNGKDIFSQKNKIFLITCYPNYSSTKRLIVILKSLNFKE